MVFTTLALCLATMLVAWPLLRLELPAVLGQVWASGAGERLSVKALSPLLLIGGVVASAWVLTPSDQEVFKGLPSEDLPSIFAIVLSTLAAVWVSSLVSKGTGVPFAFIGSLLGYRLMAEGALDWPLAARLIASWVAAPLLCALLGALFTVIVSGSQRKRPVHLALSDHRILLGCIAASLLLVAAAGCNLGQMAALFPSAALGSGPLAKYPQTPGISPMRTWTSRPVPSSPSSLRPGSPLPFSPPAWSGTSAWFRHPCLFQSCFWRPFWVKALPAGKPLSRGRNW